MVAALKQGEEHKEKTYRALCCASQPLTQSQLNTALTVPPGGPVLSLVQQTPIRVMHRRALKARGKHVVHMHAVLVPEAQVGAQETQHTAIQEMHHTDTHRRHVKGQVGCTDIVGDDPGDGVGHPSGAHSSGAHPSGAHSSGAHPSGAHPSGAHHAGETGEASSRWFVLHLRTSAGMYVKEFVHGDFGRTVPSVGSLLGCDADLLLLDVMDVHLDDMVDM